MIVVVTGARGGLGTALVETFTRAGHVVHLLNLPQFDITNPDMSLIPEFNVFINNAYDADAGFAQIDLLYAIFAEHKDRECHVINIGSVSGDGDRHNINPYCIYKAALEKASTQLSLVDGDCKVSLIKPGRMKTAMTAHRAEYFRMDPAIVADTALWMTQQPVYVNIKSVTVDLHNANRKI
jgi:NADP-dependent 3-hydroxy acid dehydrogenase YdfG